MLFSASGMMLDVDDIGEQHNLKTSRAMTLDVDEADSFLTDSASCSNARAESVMRTWYNFAPHDVRTCLHRLNMGSTHRTRTSKVPYFEVMVF